MMFIHKVAASLLFGSAVDGFRTKTHSRRAAQGGPAEQALDTAAIYKEVMRRTQGELTDEEQEPFARTALRMEGYEAARVALAVEARAAETPVPDDFPKCHLSESDCSIRDMTEATMVYTDSDTSRCWNGEPWAFLVHPGRSDKLLYYFGSGGACWEFPFLIPGAAQACFDNLESGIWATGYGEGMTDYNNTMNGLRDYTFVSPPYCGGGAHVANTTVEGVAEGTGFQYDYNNNEFAVNWALQNLDQNLESFVIAGSSAGALGTMAWSEYLLSTFQYKKATVIVDSFLGVFPEGTQGPTITNFNVCNLKIFTPFRKACEDGTANIQDVFDYAIEQHPKVAFAVVQPKWDLMQRAFYSLIGATYLKLDLYYTAAGFYQATNTMLERYGRHPNFVNYYVNGGFHTFLWWSWQYSATVAGEWSNDADGKPPLSEWTNALVNHEPVQSQCKGELRQNGGGSFWLGGTQYCDEKLYPKSLSLAR